MKKEVTKEEEFNLNTRFGDSPINFLMLLRREEEENQSSVLELKIV